MRALLAARRSCAGPRAGTGGGSLVSDQHHVDVRRAQVLQEVAHVNVRAGLRGEERPRGRLGAAVHKAARLQLARLVARVHAQLHEVRVAAEGRRKRRVVVVEDEPRPRAALAQREGDRVLLVEGNR